MSGNIRLIRTFSYQLREKLIVSAEPCNNDNTTNKRFKYSVLNSIVDFFVYKYPRNDDISVIILIPINILLYKSAYYHNKTHYSRYYKTNNSNYRNAMN